MPKRKTTSSTSSIPCANITDSKKQKNSVPATSADERYISYKELINIVTAAECAVEHAAIAADANAGASNNDDIAKSFMSIVGHENTTTSATDLSICLNNAHAWVVAASSVITAIANK